MHRRAQRIQRRWGRIPKQAVMSAPLQFPPNAESKDGLYADDPNLKKGRISGLAFSDSGQAALQAR
jgi:hypothetical protein